MGGVSGSKFCDHQKFMKIRHFLPVFLRRWRVLAREGRRQKRMILRKMSEKSAIFYNPSPALYISGSRGETKIFRTGLTSRSF